MIKSKFGIILLLTSPLPIGLQANNIIEIGDTSRVYDIDEVVVVDQPKEAFRLRQQPLSSTSFNTSFFRGLTFRMLVICQRLFRRSLCLSMEVATPLLFICVVLGHVSILQP